MLLYGNCNHKPWRLECSSLLICGISGLYSLCLWKDRKFTIVIDITQDGVTSFPDIQMTRKHSLLSLILLDLFHWKGPDMLHPSWTPVYWTEPAVLHHDAKPPDFTDGAEFTPVHCSRSQTLHPLDGEYQSSSTHDHGYIRNIPNRWCASAI